MHAVAAEERADKTRARWLETLERFRQDRDAPGSPQYWSPRLDTASRDELRGHSGRQGRRGRAVSL